jgi:hypothetical protein
MYQHAFFGRFANGAARAMGHPLAGSVSDLDFLWNVCHADAFFCRGNGEGGMRRYSCRFFVPPVKVIGL